jgi:hypothetical protein
VIVRLEMTPRVAAQGQELACARPRVYARPDAPLHDEFARLSLAGRAGTAARFGFIDVAGNLVIPPRFTEVNRFRHGLCKVAAGDTLGYISRTGA